MLMYFSVGEGLQRGETVTRTGRDGTVKKSRTDEGRTSRVHGVDKGKANVITINKS